MSWQDAFPMLNWKPGGREADVEALVEVLRPPGRPTAVFCLGDSHAREVYAAARRLGLAVPSDLAVVGFFNTPWCEIFEVPLTSVSVEEGQAARLAAEFIGGNSPGDGEIAWLRPRVVVRGSCGASSDPAALAKTEEIA